MTDSLEKAVTETARRRSVQEEFNKEHGITPKSVTRKLEEDLRINDPLGIDGDDSVDEDWEDDDTGIRPMEPLQPSSKTKKKASRYSKRAENAKLSAAVGATAARHPRPGTLSGVNSGEDQSSKLEDLERQMKEAAARLDFEEAARLRDIIRDMK